MKKILVVFLIFILLISTVAITFAKNEDQVPAKVKVIAQTSLQNVICLTVIDLSNNEIVILAYDVVPAFKGITVALGEVKRTGMFVNPNEQGSLINTNQPQIPNNNINK